MCISPTENCDSSGSCKYKSLCVLPWRWPVTTHPPEYLLRDEVDSPVLRSEVDLALQPGVGAHDEAGAVVGAVTRAFTVVCRASHGAGG